jgi:hypothetical protein
MRTMQYSRVVRGTTIINGMSEERYHPNIQHTGKNYFRKRIESSDVEIK